MILFKIFVVGMKGYESSRMRSLLFAFLQCTRLNSYNLLSHFVFTKICSQNDCHFEPASVAQWAEAQCAPTHAVRMYAWSAGGAGVQSPGRPVDFVFGFQGRVL